ncbi:Basic proline-rich protein [Madurella fahalii]|uniref:Basic proline-rich protein n=1 Tax=Madurella fahalii TaxID=1157608 RepID=A0ABQ0FX63_9PEZI
MEPVPETERMEEFRPSPLPGLRVPATPEFDFLRKPPTIRRSTDPSPTSSPISPSWALPASLPYRPRASSPLSSSHVRSRSAASLSPLPMARTQSMPGINATGHLLYSPQIRPQSPSGSPSRIRLPRKPVDEAFPTSPTRISVHDPERKLPERSSSPNLTIGISSVTSMPKLRRPSSPLCQVANAGGVPTTPSSIAISPSYRSYDPYAFSTAYPSSSMPSTPTSARSRSPSISSLETIPDSPDAEEAALEAERIAQLKAAADAADGGDAKGRSSLDAPVRGRTLSGFGSRDKRKRWSVCGAERRQDLDLETIWED